MDRVRASRSVSMDLDLINEWKHLDRQASKQLTEDLNEFLRKRLGHQRQIAGLNTEIDKTKEQYRETEGSIKMLKDKLSALERYKEDTEHQVKMDQLRKEEVSQGFVGGWTSIASENLDDLAEDIRMKITVNGRELCGRFKGLKTEVKDGFNFHSMYFTDIDGMRHRPQLKAIEKIFVRSDEE